MTGLPEDAAKQEITEHFARFGEVEDVVVCDHGYLRRSRLLSERAKAEEDAEQLTLQVSSQADTPGAQELLAEANKVVDHTTRLWSSAHTCRDSHKVNRTWCFGFGGSSGELAAAALRGSVGINVKLAPQPSDMVWEKLEVSSRMGAARLWATSLFSLVLLVLTTRCMAGVNGKHLLLPIKPLLFVYVGLISLVSIGVSECDYEREKEKE